MPYKESGTCIIGGVDDVQAILDDQIVKVQAINASPFVAPFREQSSTHESSLMTLQVWCTVVCTARTIVTCFTSVSLSTQDYSQTHAAKLYLSIIWN